ERALLERPVRHDRAQRLVASGCHAGDRGGRPEGLLLGHRRVRDFDHRRALSADPRIAAQRRALDCVDPVVLSRRQTGGGGYSMKRGTALIMIVVMSAGCSKAKESNDFASMQARGEHVMGVNQFTSAHIFEDLSDGGRVV